MFDSAGGSKASEVYSLAKKVSEAMESVQLKWHCLRWLPQGVPVRRALSNSQASSQMFRIGHRWRL